MNSSRQFQLKDKRVWLTGHTGMLGRALLPKLTQQGCDVLVANHDSLDLTRQQDVEDWLADNQPNAIIHCAALVGGIEANRTRPAEFLHQNLSMSSNVIHAAATLKTQKLLAFGSSCFYPKHSEQPIHETSLLAGGLEPTNEAYALAKIATVKYCQFYRQQFGLDFIAAVPTNLYGPGCHFDEKNSHVIAALIRKFVLAKQVSAENKVTIWGSGKPEREFLFVEDAADAALFLMQHYSSPEFINIAGGQTVSIAELANTIAQLVGFTGKLTFDTSKPDGMMKKSLDANAIHSLGWRPKTSLKDGLAQTLASFLSLQH